MIKMEKIVERFYKGLEEGKILARKCTRCGAVEFPPLLMCNECGCQEMEWIELDGKAKAYDMMPLNMLTDNPKFEFLKPYVFACVEIEEGTKRNLLLKGVTEDKYAELVDRLPMPIKLEIVPTKDYHIVVGSYEE